MGSIIIIIHHPVVIISKNLHFRFIQLMIYMVFIIDHIYHLINEFKMLIFAYNNDPILQLCVTERF